MTDHFLTDEDGSSLYGHDSRSILSASTSSRVTLNGPRQRPKGPRTSDISGSSLVERPGLPLSPLAKEIPVVQEEVLFIPSPAPSHSLNRDSISLASPKPRRSSLTRFSFRRSKLKPNVEDAFIGEDPFGSTPHPSVRWNAGTTHSNQQPKTLADGVNVSTQIKKSLSLVTPVSQNTTDQETLVSLKSKRSFFRRMADKFTRSQPPTPLSESQPQRTLKEQVLLTYTEYPTIYPSPQLPTPASSVQPSSPILPSLLVVHPDELSSVYNHEVSVTRNSSFVKLPESVSMRGHPVLPADEKMCIQPTLSTSPRNVSNTDRFLYPVQAASASWQPITPISPSKATDNYPTMRSFHKPSSNDLIPKLVEICDPSSYSFSTSKRQTTSVRSIPILHDPPPSDRRKATSVRSRQYSPSAGFNSNIQVPRKGTNSVELHQYHIHEDPQTLVNLDKAMFEKELARERERKPRREEKNRPVVHERQSLGNPHPNHDLTMLPDRRKSKRQSNISLSNFGQNTPNRTLPSKPNSAPNPSSGSKRGLGFSLSLETNFDVNTSHRLYPDILYTVDQTTDSLSSLPDINSLGRRSLPTQPLVGSLPRPIDEYPHREYIENGRDKVSRWLVSTTKTNESNESLTTSWNINHERIEEGKGYEGKGKAPDRRNYNV